jgi:hypothetical protein
MQTINNFIMSHIILPLNVPIPVLCINYTLAVQLHPRFTFCDSVKIIFSSQSLQSTLYTLRSRDHFCRYWEWYQWFTGVHKGKQLKVKLKLKSESE